jgi:hypothetical protein
LCTKVETCDASDYGPYLIGPDHDSCVENGTAYILNEIASAEAAGCGSYDSCLAEQQVSDMEAYVPACGGGCFPCADAPIPMCHQNGP